LKLGKGSFDWATLRDNKTKEIKRLNGIYNNILEGPGVEIIRGTGQIKDQGVVTVGDRELHTDRILIATGGWPFKPNVPGIEHAIDSNDVFSMETFPQDVVVVGGGYIAVEFAGIFNGLGANTQLLYRGDQILRGFDQEIRDYAAQEIAKSGVDIRVNTDIKSIEKLASGRISCTLTDNSSVECDTLMYATGRRPKTDNLGLEELGVTLRKDGTIVTDDKFKTNIPGVFALGDVIGTPALTPVALQQGMVFVNQQFGDGKRTIDYSLIPTAVFCQPNIGTIGLTEEEAVTAHPADIDVFTSEFKPLKHTITGADERTLMKLIIRRSDNRVIGVHMVGEAAGEILQGLAVAMQAGATKAHLDSTIGIHPTAAEEFVTMRSVTRSL
jgi:glutathione reductase (NADPH)